MRAVESHLLNDIAVCVVVAWLLALVAQMLKQPLVLSNLVAGILVGPIGLGWIKNAHSIETISEMGLILLLFTIGLEIDLKKIVSAGRLITVTALIQVLGGCVLGWIFFKTFAGFFGRNSLDPLYLAVAAALSSTVIIVKILYDKRELDTLPGRITLGVLVLQDLFAILFLALQPSLLNPAVGTLLLSLAKVGVLVAAAFMASRYLLPPLFKAVARLPELVQVGALAWCFLVAGLASQLELSREMGALIAGVAISTFPYTLDVTAKVGSLRDFFVTLFFVALGMTIPAPDSHSIWGALAICAFLVFSRMLTVFPPLYLMRQGHRTSWLATINLSQVSEFSLVILALGLKSQHISEATAGMIAYAFVILAVASSYGINQSSRLVPWLTHGLVRWGLPDLGQKEAAHSQTEQTPSIFLLGFFWSASSFLEEVRHRDTGLLNQLAVIDFNPQVYSELKARGVRVIYGDISRRDTLLHAGVDKAKLIICTLPNIVLKGTSNLKLLKQLRSINPEAQIVVHAEFLNEVPSLYAAGASYVVLPRILEAEELCEVVQAATKNLLNQKRSEQETVLKDRQEILP